MKTFTSNFRINALIAIIAGAVVPLGFAPFGWFPLPVLAMAVWMYLLRDAKPAHAAWYGWIFGLGLFGAGVYWVYISIYLYGNASLPLALTGYLFAGRFPGAVSGIGSLVLGALSDTPSCR